MVEPAYLLDHRQRFWLWPTWSFWNKRQNWRHVGWMFGAALGTLATVMGYLPGPFWTRFGILMGCYVVALGVLERYIRRKAVERRLENAQRALSESE